jgi:hypothetical protein
MSVCGLWRRRRSGSSHYSHCCDLLVFLVPGRQDKKIQVECQKAIPVRVKKRKRISGKRKEVEEV